jgi:hypothetical protein
MGKRQMTQFEIDFTKGYLSAVANLISTYGNSYKAVELLRCNFLSKSDMEKIGIDDSDIETLEEAIKEIESDIKIVE